MVNVCVFKPFQVFLTLFFLPFSFLFSEVMIDQQNWDRSQYKPKLEVTAKSFAKKMDQKLPSWAQEQIDEDFAHFKKGFAANLVGNIFSESLLTAFKLLRVKIENERILYSIDSANIGPEFYKIMHAIEALLTFTKLPNIDFYINLSEGLNIESPVPIFVFSKNKYLKSLVAIPDPNSLNGFKEFKKEVEKYSKKTSWDDKKNKIFWRGSANVESFFIRYNLCKMACHTPGVIDAKMSDWTNINPAIVTELLNQGVLGQDLPFKKEVEYRYLLDVDGNFSSVGRLALLLHTNCLAFKQVSDSYQWFYKALSPGKHYIPVKEDLSDLLEQFFLAEQDYPKTKKMVKRANDVAAELFTDENVYMYFAHVLLTYAKLCKSGF